MNFTAGQECSNAAKVFSVFSDSTKQDSIPAPLLVSSMGIAIVQGNIGICLVRLPSNEWSAPCAFILHSDSIDISDKQQSVILFMSDDAIISLVNNSTVKLNVSHSFLPGPLHSDQQIQNVDMYVYVRFNNVFTNPNLIMSSMKGWEIGEDKVRHRNWYGDGVSWFDVLTNKISVDRSSTGNALYIVLNMAAGKAGKPVRRNFVDTNHMSSPRQAQLQNNYSQNYPNQDELNQIQNFSNQQQNYSNQLNNGFYDQNMPVQPQNNFYYQGNQQQQYQSNQQQYQPNLNRVNPTHQFQNNFNYGYNNDPVSSNQYQNNQGYNTDVINQFDPLASRNPGNNK